MHISMNFDERTGDLLQLLCDVIARFQLDVCIKAPISSANGSCEKLVNDLRAEELDRK